MWVVDKVRLGLVLPFMSFIGTDSFSSASWPMLFSIPIYWNIRLIGLQLWPACVVTKSQFRSRMRRKISLWQYWVG
jgi:hypothetical protein